MDRERFPWGVLVALGILALLLLSIKTTTDRPADSNEQCVQAQFGCVR